jgi:alpha-beta hydrolase superfamily lysophospholipase
LTPDYDETSVTIHLTSKTIRGALVQDTTFDVSTVNPFEGTLSQAAWIFAPDDPTAVRAVLICLAGGTYDKHYWHLEVPDHAGYSFAEHLAGQGYVVVAVDHLGVGDSSDVDGPAGLELLALGDAEVVRLVRERVLEGTLVAGMPAGELPIVGVGHSMGACLTTMVQASAACYDAVVLLGYGVDITNVDHAIAAADLASSIEQNYEMLRTIAGAEEGATSWLLSRAGLRDNFYASDVPEEVIAADDAHVSRLPAQANAEVISPGFVAGHADRIDVPVFLGLGASRDVSPDPHAELANYRASSDLSLYLVAGSAHCHNMSSNRHALWDRIASWIPTTTG